MADDILIITPDLSLNGANVALMELMRLFAQKKFNMWIMASEDGGFRKQAESMNARVIISPYVKSDVEKSVLKHEFRFVFLNSSSVHYYALYFQNTQIPVYWWFHESFEQLNSSRDNFVHLSMLSSNFTFLAVTDKVARGLSDLYGVRPEILPMPIAEPSYINDSKPGNDRITFFMPASYTYIKGQDVLLKAVGRLPAEYIERSEFILAGYKIPTQEQYYDIIRKMCALLGNVRMTDEIPREEVYRIYGQCDCVIAPSRTDSTPTTAAEGLMFGKICIVSDGTGISEYITDGTDGLVFKSEDADELSGIIMRIIDNFSGFKNIGTEGRKLYEKYFEPGTVLDRINKIFSIRKE